ncbi:hypothetical protein NEOLEDRAFT_917780 [Neolentinus lepideus HHB14362 ss-1]|uniref:CoA-dependent acyltransferase n=1 Tax=Neolentinus lepideus HHB14362 ss-1 TaxID=1314782 RepID=A0A165UM81_9AGAM|nr:hypothetical protein NEOLEDRAFT_917780 [Neolentinus lepideus HHB14362 ss-1]
MNWQSTQEDGHITYNRPIWGKEKFFYATAQNQRGLATFTAQATIKLSEGSELGYSQFEERLKFAATFAASMYPMLLAKVAPLRTSGQIVCRIPLNWASAYAAISARIRRLDCSSFSVDECLEAVLTKEIADIESLHLFWAPLSRDGAESLYTVCLASPHSLLDARAAMSMLQDIFKTIASRSVDMPFLQWDLIARASLYLLPPPLDVLKSNPTVDHEAVSRCLEKWRKDASKTNYVLTPKTNAPSSEGVTRRVRYKFSREESAVLFRKFKALGVTNNTVLQSSIWLATVTMSPPTDEDYERCHCVSYLAVDSRDMLRPQWRNLYNGVGLTCPLEIVAGADRTVAMDQMMGKITEDMKFWRDSHALIDMVSVTAEGAASRSVWAAQNGVGLCNAFTANLGIVDNVLAPRYGNPSCLEVIDVCACGRITEPQYFFRAWTFNGEYHLQVNYNDHYYEEADMKLLLGAVVEAIRSTLEM